MQNPSFECTFDTILRFMLPFFLTAAAGDPQIARATVNDLIQAYNASTAGELDLVGRVIGFSTAAMDNLRLSMAPGLSDTKVLRYRSNAVTLSRASDQARKILETVQAKQEQTRKIPRPAVVEAPAPQPVPAPRPTARIAAPSVSSNFPLDIEAMKRDARIMMAAFSKQGAAAMPAVLDPTTAIKAAAHVAVTNARRTPTG
jgi:cell division septum initiation protein DivIVA